MPLVDVSKREGVATFTLNAPSANTYSFEMMKELDQAIVETRMDDAVHVIIVRGAGEKFFCAGADIAMLDAATPSFKYAFCLHANETLNRLEQTPKLVIAAINGHCVGGGLEIAMACDLRVSVKGKHKIGLPEVKLGVLPGTGGTARLSRLVGKAKALEMMLEGTNLDVDGAIAAGLVSKSFDSVNDIETWARSTFCPPGAASKAVALIKRSVQSGLEMSFEGHLSLERELQQQLFTSRDAKEGIAAYVQKRTAVFEGR
jgi:enoyl-CoA hydratase